MSAFSSRSFWTLLMLSLLCICGLAQSENQAESNPLADQQQSSGGDPDLNQILHSALQNFQRRLFYSATVSEGYISTRATSTSADSNAIRITSSWLREAFTVFRPYIALNLHRGRTGLTLQSAPVITYIPSRVGRFDINGFLDPRMDFSFALSPRLELDVSGTLRYGDGWSQAFVLRPQSSASSVSSSTSAESATQALSSAQFAVSGQVGLKWQRSRRQELSLMVGKGYSTVPGQATSNNASDVNIVRGQVVEHVTPLISLVGYSQIHQINSGTYKCTLTGGGLGLSQYARTTSWSLEAGPEYGSPGCNNRIQVSVSGGFQHALSNRTAVDFYTGRTINTFYVPGNYWVTSIGTGLHHRTSDSTSLDLTGSYLHGSNSWDALNDYSGFFLTPRFQWRVTENSTVITEYGHLASTRRSGSTLDHDWITLGLSWHPNPKIF